MSDPVEDQSPLCEIEPLTPRCALVRVRGGVDAVSVAQLEAQLAEFCVARSERIIIDLRQVGFLDSSGVHWLLRLFQRLGMDPPRLAVIASTSPAVQRVFELVRLGDVLPVADTVEQALAALEADAPHGSAPQPSA